VKVKVKSLDLLFIAAIVFGILALIAGFTIIGLLLLGVALGLFILTAVKMSRKRKRLAQKRASKSKSPDSRSLH
jgi:flagellar biosynthesis component FlhA